MESEIKTCKRHAPSDSEAEPGAPKASKASEALSAAFTRVETREEARQRVREELRRRGWSYTFTSVSGPFGKDWLEPFLSREDYYNCKSIQFPVYGRTTSRVLKDVEPLDMERQCPAIRFLGIDLSKASLERRFYQYDDDDIDGETGNVVAYTQVSILFIDQTLSRGVAATLVRQDRVIFGDIVHIERSSGNKSMGLLVDETQVFALDSDDLVICQWASFY